jgi:hypothetical protein
MLLIECASEDPILLSALISVLLKVDLDTSYTKSKLEGLILALVPSHGAMLKVISALARVLTHPPFTLENMWLGKTLSYLFQTIRRYRQLTSEEKKEVCGLAAWHVECVLSPYSIYAT